jgi:hypothetical protein
VNNLAINQDLAINKEDVSVTSLSPASPVRPRAPAKNKSALQPGFRPFKAAAQTPAAGEGRPTNAKPASSSASSTRTTPDRAVGPQLPAVPAEPPTVIALIRQRNKPTKQDVAAALTQSNAARAQKFSATEPFDLGRPVSVVERVEVQKVKIKNDAGTVELKLNETLTLEGAKVNPGKTVHRELQLSRRGDAWVISDPQARCFIPQELSVQVFSRQAEILLRQNPKSAGARMVVKALDMLFDREPASAQRAALR